MEAPKRGEVLARKVFADGSKSSEYFRLSFALDDKIAFIHVGGIRSNSRTTTYQVPASELRRLLSFLMKEGEHLGP